MVLFEFQTLTTCFVHNQVLCAGDVGEDEDPGEQDDGLEQALWACFCRPPGCTGLTEKWYKNVTLGRGEGTRKYKTTTSSRLFHEVCFLKSVLLWFRTPKTCFFLNIVQTV